MSPYRAKPYPEAESVVKLDRILPLFQEMLDYVAATVLDDNEEESLHYNLEDDEITYHMKISPTDADLFPWLRPFSEIWVIQKAGQES